VVCITSISKKTSLNRTKTREKEKEKERERKYLIPFSNNIRVGEKCITNGRDKIYWNILKIHFFQIT
jgi:hypothetical protein